MHTISRRKFVALAASGVAGMPFAQSSHSQSRAITAQQIAERIKDNVGVEWKQETVDGFKAGSPDIAVTGIATTALATLDALERAVKAGANMIVTCEPTFFSKVDSVIPPVRRLPGATTLLPNVPPPSDPVFMAKADFIREHGLIVWRFGDHWRARRPDAFTQGLAHTLNWPKPSESALLNHFTIQETSLDTLVSHIKRSLNSRGGIRVVGDPHLRVRKVALLPGTTAIQASIETLPDVDVIVAGEVREWESVEYVRDTVDLGGKKSLVLLGRIVSETPGMQICAQWLKTIVPEIPSTCIPVGDPYWRPIA
jgi:putative NIF3 family GTP cyclohydrolase 1 type 2